MDSALVVQKLIDQSQRDYQDTTPGPLYQNPNLIMDYLMEDFVKDSLAIYFTESVNEDGDDMESTGRIDLLLGFSYVFLTPSPCFHR